MNVPGGSSNGGRSKQCSGIAACVCRMLWQGRGGGTGAAGKGSVVEQQASRMVHCQLSLAPLFCLMPPTETAQCGSFCCAASCSEFLQHDCAWLYSWCLPLLWTLEGQHPFPPVAPSVDLLACKKRRGLSQHTDRTGRGPPPLEAHTTAIAALLVA